MDSAGTASGLRAVFVRPSAHTPNEPGAPGFHSALHTIQLYMDNIERHVLANPAVVLDPETYRAAYRAYEALGDTFQELASIALERAMGELDEEKGGEEGPRRS